MRVSAISFLPQSCAGQLTARGQVASSTASLLLQQHQVGEAAPRVSERDVPLGPVAGSCEAKDARSSPRARALSSKNISFPAGLRPRSAAVIRGRGRGRQASIADSAPSECAPAEHAQSRLEPSLRSVALDTARERQVRRSASLPGRCRSDSGRRPSAGAEARRRRPQLDAQLPRRRRVQRQHVGREVGLAHPRRRCRARARWMSGPVGVQRDQRPVAPATSRSRIVSSPAASRVRRGRARISCTGGPFGPPVAFEILLPARQPRS
jgi:hypothetical protein